MGTSTRLVRFEHHSPLVLGQRWSSSQFWPKATAEHEQAKLACRQLPVLPSKQSPALPLPTSRSAAASTQWIIPRVTSWQAARSQVAYMPIQTVRDVLPSLSARHWQFVAAPQRSPLEARQDQIETALPPSEATSFRWTRQTIEQTINRLCTKKFHWH